MKRIIIVFLCAVCVGSLCSCGNAGYSSKDASTSAVTSVKDNETAVAPDIDNTEKAESIYILGDSCSAFEDCIPEGFATWYLKGGNGKNNVTDKSMLWWQLLVDNKNFTLFKNNSCSGTTICNTGYGGEYCPDTSFIGRFEADIENGVFEGGAPDRIIIFGGTNDSWAGAPVGEIKQTAFSEEDLREVLPAFCYLLLRINDALPDIEITVIINTELKNDITYGLMNACISRNVKYVRLQGVSKQEGHPDMNGMYAIYEQLCAVLKS